jgi:hypothetical protein
MLTPPWWLLLSVLALPLLPLLLPVDALLLGAAAASLTMLKLSEGETT